MKGQSPESGEEGKQVNRSSLSPKRSVVTLGSGGWDGGDYPVNHHSSCGFFLNMPFLRVIRNPGKVSCKVMHDPYYHYFF